MTLTTKIKKAAQGLNPDICKTFAFAASNGFPTDYFPEEYSVLKQFKKEDFVKEDIPEAWLKDWIKLWPSAKEANLSYAVRATPKAVKDRMNPFLRDMCERLGLDDCDLDYRLGLIWDATVFYLEQQENKNWKYTKKAVKFIQDSESSFLELYIQKYLEEGKRNNRVA